MVISTTLCYDLSGQLDAPAVDEGDHCHGGHGGELHQPGVRLTLVGERLNLQTVRKIIA